LNTTIKIKNVSKAELRICPDISRGKTRVTTGRTTDFENLHRKIQDCAEEVFAYHILVYQIMNSTK